MTHPARSLGWHLMRNDGADHLGLVNWTFLLLKPFTASVTSGHSSITKSYCSGSNSVIASVLSIIWKALNITIVRFWRDSPSIKLKTDTIITKKRCSNEKKNQFLPSSGSQPIHLSLRAFQRRGILASFQGYKIDLG